MDRLGLRWILPFLHRIRRHCRLCNPWLFASTWRARFARWRWPFLPLDCHGTSWSLRALSCMHWRKYTVNRVSTDLKKCHTPKSAVAERAHSWCQLVERMTFNTFMSAVLVEKKSIHSSDMFVSLVSDVLCSANIAPLDHACDGGGA